MKEIYLDNSATTPLSEEVLAAMTPYLTGNFGNPDSLHSYGRSAVKAVDEARDLIAECLHAKSNEIYFTSGATESDNWALKGTLAASKKGKHALVSSIEHPALIKPANYLKTRGYDIDFIPADKSGIIDVDFLKRSVRGDTVIVCCMTANNEIGTIQPVDEVVKAAKSVGAYAMTDAVQAVGALDISVDKTGVDMLSLSAHKFYGPKGVGLLYVKTGVKIDPLVEGGEQERKKRGGTTNVAGVVGMSVALKRAIDDREVNSAKILALRERFVDEVLFGISGVKLNGDREKRLPLNADFSFEGVNGEALLYNLDLAGIAASNGSACSSGTVEPSHVLSAIGLSAKEASSSVRFTFGKNNTAEEVDFAAKTLKTCVERLRNLQK
ncbi:MAG TPA: cysteine desulfurase NifS [Clostridiales bacterium]|nr:cysteine desulfurase NifS [Clostridiales bacterium]